MPGILSKYFNTFKGLSREVWWLSLITFINRSGTMVIPFLSLYLTNSLGFSLAQTGWIMTFFGIGSVIGTWIGGKLTDKIGYYSIMFSSLILTGLFFILLQYVTSFIGFSLGIFLVMLVADAFRPAMFVALTAYSKPENKTRSVTLIRLAINLGFSAGPAIGGLIIAGIGYQGLFWMDGITCALAAILLIFVLHPKKARVQDEVKNDNPISAYSDRLYWIFFTGMFIFGFVFMQYFSTVPIFYKEIYALSEFEIGLLLGGNGLFIFIFEMPLIKWLEDSREHKIKLIFIGLFLVCLSFAVLNLPHWIGVLIIGMFLMTIGEMIAFPFSNAFAVERSKKGNAGQYMAMYAISFSLAHIFSHNSGMQLIHHFGFQTTWNLIAGFAFIGVLILVYLWKALEEESNSEMSISETPRK